MAESIRALRADRVVPRRVYAAVRDTHVAAAIDVDSVAIGVDLQIVDRQIVDTGRQNGEVSAGEHRQIAKNDVIAILQGDRFVSHAWRLSDR